MKLKFFPALFLALCILAVSRCKKKETITPSQPPSVSTTSVLSTQDSTALIAANVSAQGSSILSAVGICWDINPSPTLLRSHSAAASSVGSFTAIAHGLLSNTTYYVRAYASNFFGTTYGNEISFKTGKGWNLCFPIIGNQGYTYCNCFLASGATLYSGWTNGVYKSNDNGSTWVACNFGLTNLNVSSLLLDGTNLFAGTSGGMYKSADAGNSWQPAGTGITNSYISAMASCGNRLFVSTQGGLFLSSDHGASWNQLSDLGQNAVSFITVSGATLYVGELDNYTYQHHVFISTNSGSSWNLFNTSFLSAYYGSVTDMAVAGSKLFAATNYGLYLSGDQGATWTMISTTQNAMVHVLANNNYVFAASQSNSSPFYLSADNGNTVSATTGPGSNSNQVFALGVANNYVFMGLTDGIYRLPL